MAKTVEDAIAVHKTEIVFYDKIEERHYRLNTGNITKILFDYQVRSLFFGLKKELVERIVFYINDPDIPEVLEVWEHKEPNFRRFRGGLRTFVDDNSVALEIYDAEGNLQK